MRMRRASPIQLLFKFSTSLASSNKQILFSFEQSERLKHLRELRANMLLGKLTRFLLSFKFKIVSFF